MKQSSWGFGWGAGTGVTLALVALLIAEPVSTAVSNGESLGGWLNANLGHSIWLFAIVFTLYVLNLQRLNKLVSCDSELRDVEKVREPASVPRRVHFGNCRFLRRS